jgi:thiosulfate/3-mercaptopyruvate sulfurtransferase
MLRVTGRQAALLDGGMRPDDPCETGPVRPGPADLHPPGPGRADALVALEDVAAAGPSSSTPGRPERFAGAPAPARPAPGHLPGRAQPALRDNVGRRRLACCPTTCCACACGRRRRRHDAVVSSCGSGVTACHTLLVLEHLGLPAGRLYPGSWSQWAADPERPVELGPGR